MFGHKNSWVNYLHMELSLYHAASPFMPFCICRMVEVHLENVRTNMHPMLVGSPENGPETHMTIYSGVH